MNDRERARFDALVERVLATLPPTILELFDEAPLIIEDRPDPQTLRELDMDPNDPEEAASLCGLHTGLMITERSIEDQTLPSQIHIFREGIVLEAGGWDRADAEDRVLEQIRITILHEVGHEMGLDEDDLDELGYA